MIQRILLNSGVSSEEHCSFVGRVRVEVTTCEEGRPGIVLQLPSESKETDLILHCPHGYILVYFGKHFTRSISIRIFGTIE